MSFHRNLFSSISIVLTAFICVPSTPVEATNHTNITVPSTPFPTQPLKSCIEKNIWNVCWLKTPPYVFESLTNKSHVVGILTETLIEGLKRCDCRTSLNFTLRVHDEKDLINCSTSQDIDFIFPFPPKGVRNKQWFFKVVDSPEIYLLLNRKRIELLAKEDVFKEFSEVWTVAVLTILLAAIFGIVVWSLDTSWNQKQFPPTFYPGSLEGIWWSFVTLTTVGYGDKAPKFHLARVFAVVWMFVGMCLVSLLTAMMTKALTTGIIENRRDMNSKEIGVMKNSYTYDQAVKKGAKPIKFSDLQDMYNALKNNTIEGILVDVFVATYIRNNPDRFHLNDNIFVAHSYEIAYSPGFYLGPGITMQHSQQLESFMGCMKEMFDPLNNRIDVYAIVEKYIQPPTIAGKTTTKNKYDPFKIEINLFGPQSETFIVGAKVLSSILGILIFFGIIWEIIRCRQSSSRNISKRNDTMAMSANNTINVTNLSRMVEKLDEVEKALNKLAEFKEMYAHYKPEIEKYNNSLKNRNVRNGAANIGFTNT